MTYDPSTAAILLIDPYSDFLSEGGKLWPRAKAVAEQVNLLDHLRAIVKVAMFPDRLSENQTTDWALIRSSKFLSLSAATVRPVRSGCPADPLPRSERSAPFGAASGDMFRWNAVEIICSALAPLIQINEESRPAAGQDRDCRPHRVRRI
jgi:hypothetical protein